MSPSEKPEPQADANSDRAAEDGRPDGAAQDSRPDGAAEEPADDVREKFREALARKQGKEKGVPHYPDQAGGSAHTQSAKTQRMFRRKSG